MKNILRILLLAGIVLCFTSSHAQLVAGLKAGVNYSGVSDHDGKRFGAHGGLFIHSAFNKKWHIQPELLYSNEGYTYTTTETIPGGFQGFEETERTVSINTVNIPVMFQYYASPKFFIEAGPQLSITVSATDKAAAEKLNVKRSLSSTQFAMNAGLGYMVSNQIAIYARYSYGLTDITLHDDNADQNRVLQAGCLFRLK